MTAAGQRPHQPLRGIIYIVFAMLVLTIQDALVKWLTADFAVVQILFVRSVVMSVPIFFLLYRAHGLGGLRTRRPFGHTLRLALNLIAFVLFFFALARLPLADTLALMMTAPLFMALLSGPLLGEYPQGKTVLAIGVGFVGVLVMSNPYSVTTGTGTGVDMIGTLAVLAASVFYTLWMIQTRHLSSTEPGPTMVLYSAVGIAAATAVVMPLYWRPVESAGQWLLLGLVGLVSALGHTLLVQAYRYAPVYVLGPFDYTTLVWGVVIGFLVWGDLPGPNMVAGSALVVGCGLYLYWRAGR